MDRPIDRPIDRFMKWGQDDDTFGMVFGEPDTFVGKPMQLVGAPAGWDELVSGDAGEPLNVDGDIFDKVKQERKKR